MNAYQLGWLVTVVLGFLAVVAFTILIFISNAGHTSRRDRVSGEQIEISREDDPRAFRRALLPWTLAGVVLTVLALVAVGITVGLFYSTGQTTI